ncbi:MAG: PEP-CTERM system TPR-repeat protein PrsT [Rhodocyclaceae bacterium]|nr:PEP-CTERM system TPR-repeat protein PrsT [Rhodocyclaceae bacterium]
MKPDKPARIIPAAALLAALLIGGCGGGSAEEMIASAKGYLEKNDHAAAIIQLKNALASNQNSAEARFLLGRALLDSGDPVSAEVELRKAVETGYPAGKVTPLLARALLAQGQFKKVLDEMSGGPTASPEDLADLKTTIGLSHAMQGRMDAASAAFDAALAAKGDHAPALLGLARLKTLGRDMAGAQAIIDDILAKSPRNADAWHFKAELLRMGGNAAEAVQAYQKVVEIKPQAISAHAALIMSHLREQKADLAGKQLDAMQKVAAKHPLTLYMQGLVAFGRKDLPAVRSAMEALLKMYPDNPQGLQLAGIAAYEARSDIQAQEYLAKALQKAPGLDFGRRILVMSQLRGGQPARALATLRPVLQGSETGAAWLALAGEAYMQSGDAKSAEEFFVRAAKSDPKDRRTQTALAMARMQMGRVDQAFTDLEQIAAADSGVSADMALIASSMQRKQFDKALKAIANFEKKQPDNPAVHNLRGGVLLGKGDSDGARKNFEKALSVSPAYLPAATSLARMDLAAKKPDQARQRFESVLAKDPKNVQAMLALAELRTRSGAGADEVAGLIGKAVAAAPDDPTPRLALIGLHVSAKDSGKALTAVQEAMAALPDRPEILDVAGRVFQLTGDTNQALATYGKLAILLPTAAHPYLRMAEIQVAAKNKDGARGSLAKGLSLQPDSLPMQRAMIIIDVADKRFDEALAMARNIQKARPKEAAGHILEGDIHLAQKAWPQAAVAYRAGLKAAPATDLAERLHAVLMIGGQAAEAAGFVDSWLKAHPKDNAFRMFIADSANKRKDYGAAVAQYRAMLAAAPDNPALLNNLAWSLGQMKDPKAIAYAEQANKLAPNQPAIMDTLGMLLIEQGNAERGLELLAKAVASAPQAAEIRLNHARALLKAGKKSAAKQELEVLAKLGDKYPAHAEVTALLKGL